MAAKFTSAAEAELACGVCFQFFVKPHEPKNLPNCLHILCQVCLKKMTEGGQRHIKCPHCNKISPLPKEGVGELKTSLALRNLAERHPKGIEQYREHMQSQLKLGKENNAKKVTKLKELLEQTEQAIKVEEQEIEKTVEAVMEKAYELRKQLINSSGLDQLQEQLKKLETEMKHINYHQSKLETMTDEEFHAQTDAITNQIEKLKIDDVKEYTVPHVGRFIANIQLGRIVEPRKLELVQEFGEFTEAWGIESNSGVIAVGDWKSKPQRVSIFQKDGAEYKLQSEFPVHPWSDVQPLSIAICKNKKILVTKCSAGFDVYSSDGKFQKIESVIDEQTRKGKKIYVASCSFCSTKDGRILVGSSVETEGEESEEYVVTVHNEEGTLIKTVPIAIMPFRITDINGTHVAVCDVIDNQVCVYDMQTGEETLSIDVQSPCGICYDEQSDCLLIAKMTETDEDGSTVDGSGVIEQYCRITGKLVARLAHELQRPTGLTITEDNIFAVTDNKTMKLYKMD